MRMGVTAPKIAHDSTAAKTLDKTRPGKLRSGSPYEALYLIFLGYFLTPVARRSLANRPYSD